MRKQSLNFEWLRMLGEPPMGPFADHVDTKMVDLPDDFILEMPRAAGNPGGPANAYFPQGYARYTKKFAFAPEWAGQTVLLDLDGSYMLTEVYCNNSKVGYHPYGYTGYLCDLTGSLRDGENTLLIHTQCRQPSTRWYSGGGIFREVSLWTGGALQIRPWDLFVTTPEISAEKAIVHIEADVTNVSGDEEHAKVIFRVGDASAQAEVTVPAGKSAKACADIVVEQPRLWSCEQPELYAASAQVYIGENLTDEAETTFGIRSIEITGAEGFKLNGERIKLRGGCIHHDNGPIGARAMPAAEERKLRILKEAGYNAVRSAHNPPSTALLDAADRLGMLVLDESFDCWVQAKPSQDYHLYFEDWWERDTIAMVKRDRNHPSVWAYSIGNEIPEFFGQSNGVHWAKMQAECVHKWDPTRPVTAALANMFHFEEKKKDKDEGGFKPPLMGFDLTEKATGYLQPGDPDRFYDGAHEAASVLDVVGYNYSFRRMGYDRIVHPERAVVGFESQPVETYDTWQAVMDNDNVLGDHIWTAFDNMGEAGVGRPVWDLNGPVEFMGPYPWLACHQGDHDLAGERRPQSYYRKLMWGKDSGVRLFTTRPEETGKPFWGAGWHWEDVVRTWTFDKKWIGKPVRAAAYSDADEVEFLCNGKSMGRCPVVRLSAECIFPYEPGVVEAIGYKNGEEYCRDRIETTGEPVGVRLFAEKEAMGADGMDLGYVWAEFVDSEGRRVYNADIELNVSVSGAGTLLGLGSGNPCTAENYGTGRRFTFRGRALAVIRAAREAGEVEICVSTPGLPSAKLVLCVK